MLTNCCKELTSVNWFTISVGLIGLSGSWACSCAVSNEINKLGLARPFADAVELLELVEDVPEVEDVVVPAGIAKGLFVTCMIFPPIHQSGCELQATTLNPEPRFEDTVHSTGDSLGSCAISCRSGNVNFPGDCGFAKPF